MHVTVGREYVLSVLTRYLDAALQGSGACVLLEGAVGLGKSRILKAIASEGAKRGLAVAYMRAGAPDEAAIIRKLIVFLRHVMSGEADFNDRELQDLVRPDANPFVLAERLSEMIAEAAQRRPLLIILDDAQQVDEISGVALQGLIRPLSSAPVLSLLARRPVLARSLAQHAIGWLCDRATVRLRLGPLDDAAAAALCASTLGAKPDSSVLAWAARCGGNPQLLKSLMSAFMEAGQLVIVDGTASVLADRLPESVLSAIHDLPNVVPPGVRGLLLHGGQDWPRFPVVDEASAGELGSGQSSIGAGAVQAGLGNRNGGEDVASPRPDMGSPVPIVGQRQSEWTGVDDALTAPPGRQADIRLVVATSPSSPACGCESVAAQVIAALGDPLEAPRTLARALCLLAGAGRGAEASRLADVAVRTGLATAAEARLVLDLVPGLQNVGCHTLSSGHLRRTLARRDLRESERTKLEGLLAEAAERARSVRSVGGTLHYGRWTSTATPFIDGHRQQVSVIEAAASRDEPDGPHCAKCGCPSWGWVVRTLIAADQFDEATAVAAAIKQAAQTHGEPWHELVWHGHRAELLLTLGRLGQARAAAETGIRLTERSAPKESLSARAVLARISLHYGDTATASEHLRMAERLVTDDTAGDKIRLDWALAQFHAACGRPGMAVHTLINVEANFAPDMLLFVEAPTAAAMLVRLAKKAGLSSEADHAARHARRVTELNPDVASLAGGAEHAEGLLRRDPDALRRAVEYYRLSGRPLAVGMALEDTAQEEYEGRRPAEAVELLGSALDLYMQCNARRDVTRVQKKLRRLGVHHVGEHGADRPTSGWESLTNAELRVVRAIVDGKTNKEAASTLFLSPHTVDSHLRRVFGKLGINTRVQLTKHFLTHEAA